MATRILVVEDEYSIQELIRVSLVGAGFKVSVVSSAEEALVQLKQILPQLIFVDWMLPGISGLALARQLRQNARTAQLPIIMVTARAEELDRIQGLETGADDYMIKPFSPRELVARTRAVLRRSAPQHLVDTLEIAGLQLDPVTYSVKMDGRDLALGPTEFKLLHFFLTHPERVYSRRQLLDEIWGDHCFIEERTVDVTIRRLRANLGERGTLIQTVRSIGYKLTV